VQLYHLDQPSHPVSIALDALPQQLRHLAVGVHKVFFLQIVLNLYHTALLLYALRARFFDESID